MKLAFIVMGKPQGKQRARRSRYGHWYTPRQTVKYEQAVQAECLVVMTQKGIPKRQACSAVVSVSCFFPDATRRDGDNVLKAVQDALNGVLWDDDSQVIEATVRTAIDRDLPRTEVAVELLESEAA